uniref:Thioredoxin domain-containing protein n=1 Tax=Schlesneria paludicola TaxID=360056 RepID=A0A7C4QMH3_9PLAN
MTVSTGNRLRHETSPYLRQHAGNPVDWHPWDETALRLARELDRPIFLSIGYSACHWCHVMERESFEHPEIAALMNQWFVNIKVDREERPDLDQLYMNAVLALSGSGGWPMSVFLTPHLEPFFGGTYWPPEARWGRPGFRDILKAVHEAWTTRRSAVLSQAAELTAAVVEASRPHVEQTALNVDTLRQAQRSLLRAADRRYGGFGGAPKFPHPLDLRLLLRCWRRFQEPEALEVVRLTLDQMARGGIYDHLGGGFARYSTDERWLVPHFEKMLYDNALLTPAYLDAYQASGERRFAEVAGETLDYVLREMQLPEGGFASTQDADSEGEEGKFFVWTEAEILRELGPEDGPVFAYCYDVTAAGNWEHKNILHRPKTPAQAAQLLGRDPAQLEALLARCREKLFAARARRVPPARDDKVLAAWNGLMLAALARGANVLGVPRYAEAARRAADFLLGSLRREDGRLWHTVKDGRARLNGYLDDYAALIDGLIELSQAVWDPRYLSVAVELAEILIADFWDDAEGGFFYTPSHHERLIARPKDTHDGATPSGNGLAALALLKLARLSGRGDLEDYGRRTLDLLSATMTRLPLAAGQALLAWDAVLGPACEIIICDGDAPAENDAVWRTLHQHFLPHALTFRLPRGTADAGSTGWSLFAGKTPLQQQVTAYVCEQGACQAPQPGAAAITAELARLAARR